MTLMGLKHIRDAIAGTTLTLHGSIVVLVLFSACSTVAGLTAVVAGARSERSTYTERDLGLGALAGFIAAAVPCAVWFTARLRLGERFSKIFSILILPFCLIGVGPLVAAVISLLTIGEAPKALLGASAMTAFLTVPILGCVFVFFLPLLLWKITGAILACILTVCGATAVEGFVFVALSKHWGWYVCHYDAAAIASAVYGVVLVGYSSFLYWIYFLGCIPCGFYLTVEHDRVYQIK